MTVAENKAHAVVGKMVSQHGVAQAVAFDPILILAIINAIYSIARLWQMCGLSPMEAVDKIGNPGMLGRIRFNRAVSKALDGKECGRYKGEVKLAMWDSRGEITVEDVGKLYAEIERRKEKR